MKILEKTPVELSEVIIGPADAEMLLKRRDKNCRPIDWDYVRQYAEDIACGKWDYGWDPIVLNKEGKLVNGSTRLQALLFAGQTNPYVTMNVLIMKGLNVNVASDRGKIRHTSDALKAAYGVEYPREFTRMTEFLYGLTCKSMAERGEKEKEIRIRGNGLHPDHTRFVIDQNATVFENLSRCPLEKGTPSSKMYYRASLLLLFLSGRYRTEVIINLAGTFHGYAFNQGYLPEQKWLLKLYKDIEEGKGEFRSDNVDTRPGGIRYIKYMKEVLRVLMSYLEEKQYGNLKPVSSKEAGSFLSEQVDHMYAQMFKQIEIEKRIYLETSKQKGKIPAHLQAVG